MDVAATNFIPRAVIAARTIRNRFVVGDVPESRSEVIETTRARLAVALVAIPAVELIVPLRVRLLEMSSQLHLRFEVELATHLTAFAAVKVTAASVASALRAKADGLGITKSLVDTRVCLKNMCSNCTN